MTSDNDLIETRTNAEQSETSSEFRVSFESEEWRPVVGFEGFYEVSSTGMVYSCRRARLLRPHKDSDGYPRIGLWNGERQRKLAVHRLVAEAFLGEKRNALHCEVAHLDGNASNPRATNLKWVSKVENRSHRKLHGTETNGERHGNSKLTEDAVRLILTTPESRARLAERFGVTPWAIDDVRSGRNWKHITHECHG